jgi:hypothetical protein
VEVKTVFRLIASYDRARVRAVDCGGKRVCYRAK